MKKTGVSILNLERDGKRLDWTVQKYYINDKGEKIIFSDLDYHTNNAGDGLWRGDKQIVGTLDFKYSAKDPRRSFYRYFSLTDSDIMEMKEHDRWHSMTKEERRKELELDEALYELERYDDFYRDLDFYTREEFEEGRKPLVAKVKQIAPDYPDYLLK